MKRWLLVVLALTACNSEPATPPPPPQAMGSEAIGHFCMMNVAEHPGPKGQAFIEGKDEPVWFPSVRDLLTFRALPGETAKITALYVSDTGAAGPDRIDPQRWVAAKDAFFVINTQLAGGMGLSEAFPFADRDAAESFAATHEGEVVLLDAIGPEWIFGEPS